MKNYIIVTLMMAFFQMQAQDVPYQPLVVEGRTWVNYYFFSGDEGDTNPETETFQKYFSYEFIGDSIFNGNTYKKCYKRETNHLKEGIHKNPNETIIWGDKKFAGLVREDNMKVYAHFNTDNMPECIDFNEYDPNTSEFLLYDFINLRELAKKGEIDIKQVSIAETMCNGYQLEDDERGTIESIGKSTGFGTLLDPKWSMKAGEYFNIIGLSHVLDADGNIIYKSPKYKEEPSGVDDVKVTTLPSDNRYYNLQGQRVSEPAAGIYIHKGKKIFVK